METETKTNMKIFACIEMLLVVCATCCYIFVNPLTSCLTDRYQPQQFINLCRPLSAHGNYHLHNDT